MLDLKFADIAREAKADIKIIYQLFGNNRDNDRPCCKPERMRFVR